MVMDTMDTMARDLLMLRLSLDTATMVLDMDMATMDTMARDLLMLRPPLLPSQDMDTMAMDMDTMVMGMDMDMVMDTMDMDMVMVMDTTDKSLSFLLCSLEFSTNEIGPSFGTSHFQ